MKLQSGMFGTEFSAKVDNHFELHTGQMRMPDVMLMHNAGWYNSDGVKIGWGDLDAEDFCRIRVKLEPEDLFVVLGETDSFWNFVKQAGSLGSNCITSSEEANPGRAYIAEHARFIISSNQIIYVDEWFVKGGAATERHIFGIKFDIIDRDSCRKMLNS